MRSDGAERAADYDESRHLGDDGARLVRDRPRLGLLRGDGMRLTFGDAALSGAFFCHVPHLIPDWRGALREAGRVLRPDGELLLEHRKHHDDVRRQLHRHLRETLVFTPPPAIGVRDEGLVGAALTEMGRRGGLCPGWSPPSGSRRGTRSIAWSAASRRQSRRSRRTTAGVAGRRPGAGPRPSWDPPGRSWIAAPAVRAAGHRGAHREEAWNMGVAE